MVAKANPFSPRLPCGDVSWLFYVDPAFEGRDVVLAWLGKHKTGKVRVYVRRLADVDLMVLATSLA